MLPGWLGCQTFLLSARADTPRPAGRGRGRGSRTHVPGTRGPGRASRQEVTQPVPTPPPPLHPQPRRSHEWATSTEPLSLIISHRAPDKQPRNAGWRAARGGAWPPPPGQTRRIGTGLIPGSGRRRARKSRRDQPDGSWSAVGTWTTFTGCPGSLDASGLPKVRAHVAVRPRTLRVQAACIGPRAV